LEPWDCQLGYLISKKNGREKGIDHVLLEELIIRSEKKWHPKNIYLHVVLVNKKTSRLYQSLGFQIIEQLPQWFEYNKKYLDEYLLIFDKERFFLKQKKKLKKMYLSWD
jgi:ribosomal protein S18 acetylase RimI-like enzyme